MPVPKIIVDLVERFDRNIESYKNGKYNETQVRNEFINPFFEALGWDVINKAGYAEAYKDVIHEYSLKTKDVAKAPDYLFRIGGAKKFFVEAKKPSVNLKDDISPAFQLRRYAWSAKLSLSILTDFEEFAVYDCRVQPKKNDKSSTARIKYLTFKDYIDKWDEIESVFSKDAVLKGSFDKYAEIGKGKRGTSQVDDAFLSEIEKWRELLARNIALRNSELTNRQLNYSVQKIIDRIIFLRISEDRGIEDYGQLYSLLNGINIYKRLQQIFTRADEKYNSGLFHFDEEKNRTDPPDEITPTLSIDGKVLKDIFKNLYYPDCPYEFSVLGTDILGHVYEQFLGKVIRLTAGHRAIIEEKPEVKKAGGVYYTPTYIVDYIVKNTVGKKLEEIDDKYLSKTRHAEFISASKNMVSKQVRSDIGKIIKETSKLKILDPACGSGSFLLGAYQYLLDWYLKIYTSSVEQVSNLLAKKAPPIYRTKTNEYRLTTNEKKRILLNNIYGVDIDNQAVEVTKLSLLLKVLEGETDETLNTQLSMFKERALPDLSNNIKCGNSLIGPDFYDQMEMNFLDEEEKLRINVFDWETEFKEIMNAGGFDCVIGNPPWVDIKGMEPFLVDYYFKKYHSSSNRMNIYATFIERSIILINEKSYFGFITPVSFFTQSSYKNLREIILKKTSIVKVIRMPDKVFKNVTAESVVTIFSKKQYKKCKVLLYNRRDSIRFISETNCKTKHFVEYKKWGKTNDKIFAIYVSDKINSVLKHIEKDRILLSDLCDFTLGITPYDKYKGHTQEQIKSKVFHSEVKKDKTFKPLLKGSDVSRYSIVWTGSSFLSYGNWLGAPREKKFFTEPRILIRQIISGNPLRMYCGYTEEELYNTQTIFNLILKKEKNISLKYLLGVLNSKLISFYHRYRFLDLSKDTFQKILIQDAKKIPIHIEETKLISNLILFSDRMISLNTSINNTKTPQEKTALQRQIEAADKQIDKLVYELYGLTEEEIKIIEESF